MERLLRGPGDHKYTRKSHLFSSIVGACGDSMMDSFVVQRILNIVLGEEFEHDNGESAVLLSSRFDWWAKRLRNS